MIIHVIPRDIDWGQIGIKNPVEDARDFIFNIVEDLIVWDVRSLSFFNGSDREEFYLYFFGCMPEEDRAREVSELIQYLPRVSDEVAVSIYKLLTMNHTNHLNTCTKVDTCTECIREKLLKYLKERKYGVTQ